MPAERVRVLVVDDEPLARMRIEDVLSHLEGAEIVGSASNGIEAVEMIRSLKPDLVFLDVQMPGKTGVEVVREIGPSVMPATIFVTAYDQFAVQAFDVAAVDYLVKPFDDERLESAFERARSRLALEGLGQLREKLLAVLQTPGTASAQPTPAHPHTPEYLERIAVEMRGKVQSIPVDQIDYIVQSGPYAELHSGGRRHLIREAMQTLEERLDPRKFMRVHRSMIVRLDLVEALHRGTGGDYEVQLKGGARVKVSRSRRDALERWLGVSR
ncbi:MAG TPA: LytTR family DNA-binding domain-containing protein [Gemmatimonadaceae bacterium]|nr:LytTR family DNA-binding domain-containing protein [Gemmatimonadaceae bacterium]